MDASPADLGAPRVSRRRVGARIARTAAIIVSVVVLLLVAFLPVDSPTSVRLFHAAELAVLAATLIAASRMPPGIRRVWGLFAVFLTLWLVGDLIYDYLYYTLQVSPFPSWADAFYLGSYVPEVAALTILVRQRRTTWDRQLRIDSTVVALAAVSVAGAFVIRPMILQSSFTDFATYLALLYPLADLVVLTLVVRLVVGGGRPPTALLVLIASVSVTMVADLLYNGVAANVTGEETAQWIDVMYLAGILLMGFAATAPSAALIGQAATKPSSIMSSGRVVALTVGTLTPPVLLAVMVLSGTAPAALFLAVMSIAVNLLVLRRILLLMGIVRQQSERLDRQSRTDVLTGLPNRRSWDFAVTRAVERAHKNSEPLTIAILDLDEFKSFNDSFGHVAGDQLLAQSALAWRAALDPGVFLARYGGEEFACLLPGLSPDEVVAALEGVRRSTPPPVTVSIGCARFSPDRAVADTVRRADSALYAAKEAGRNQLIVSSVEVEVPRAGTTG